jgi:hypothetical protein
MNERPATRKTRRPDTISEAPTGHIMEAAKINRGLVTPQELTKVPEILEEENRIISELAYGAGKAYEKIKNTMHESQATALEKTQKILDEIDSAYANYDISQTLRRAETENISLMDTVEEAYAEIFDNKIKKNPRDISNSEKAILKHQIIEMITKRFEDFFPAFERKKEQEIIESINELPDKFKTRLLKTIGNLEDKYTENAEINFRKYIEPIVAAKIIREQQPEESPGLLHIDIHSEPKTEDISIQELPKQKPAKKPNKISGLFKRLFS